jgi:hypothetical protein
MRQGRRDSSRAVLAILSAMVLLTLPLGCASTTAAGADAVSLEAKTSEGRWRQAAARWPEPTPVKSLRNQRLPHIIHLKRRHVTVTVRPPVRERQDAHGVVARIDGDLNIVLISIERGADLEVGDGMTVYRNTEYLGKLVIDKRGDDWAAGHMYPELTKTFPKKGDCASTQL